MSESAGTKGVAVVTGGTAGVGRATVRSLADSGYDVAVIARDPARLAVTVAEVEQKGRRAIPLAVDVADAEAMLAAAERVERELGPIEVWVNNAFTGAIAFFEDVQPHEYQRITDVTYHGYVNGTRAALRCMRPRDRGVIVQVGSALAFRGIPLQAAYCGAKHAIRGFTESVRTELLHRRSNVRLCEVHLPAINTPQFSWVLHRGISNHPQPVPPIYQPELAARAVAHVIAHPRRSMWFGLPTVFTILANRLAPGLIDRYLARSNVDAQQAPQYNPPGPETNLFQPVYGDDVAAHGIFDDEAYSRSPQLWANSHRAAAAVAAVGLVAAVAVRAARR